MANTIEEAVEMIPFTKESLCEGREDKWLAVVETTPPELAELLVYDTLDFEPMLGLEMTPPNPVKSEEEAVNRAIEALYDVFGDEHRENPKFVSFPETPELDDEAINIWVRDELEGKYRTAAKEWWAENKPKDY